MNLTNVLQPSMISFNDAMLDMSDLYIRYNQPFYDVYRTEIFHFFPDISKKPFLSIFITFLSLLTILMRLHAHFYNLTNSMCSLCKSAKVFRSRSITILIVPHTIAGMTWFWNRIARSHLALHSANMLRELLAFSKSLAQTMITLWISYSME